MKRYVTVLMVVLIAAGGSWTTAAVAQTAPDHAGGGVVGSMGPGAGHDSMGPDMMGPGSDSDGGPQAGRAKPMSLDQAREAARKFLNFIGYQNLTIGEVKDIGSSYAVSAMEADGSPAKKILVNKTNGSVISVD